MWQTLFNGLSSGIFWRYIDILVNSISHAKAYAVHSCLLCQFCFVQTWLEIATPYNDIDNYDIGLVLSVLFGSCDPLHVIEVNVGYEVLSP